VLALMMACIEAETCNHCKLLMMLFDGVFNKCIEKVFYSPELVTKTTQRIIT